MVSHYSWKLGGYFWQAGLGQCELVGAGGSRYEAVLVVGPRAQSPSARTRQQAARESGLAFTNTVLRCALPRD